MLRHWMWNVAFLALVLVVGVGAEVIHACSCVPPPAPKVAKEAAAAVFVGKVTKIAPGANQFQREVTFKVDRQWKGIDAGEVTVTTATDGALCGYEFQMGESYLVYCHKAEKTLSTNICTRTKPLASAKDDLAEIGEPVAIPEKK